jgi:hypothetical protein
MLVAMFLPVPARAQADADVVPVIEVHPRVPTILQLGEAIEDAWIIDANEFRVMIVGEQLYVRPLPGTPAGREAKLDVKTRTRLRTFQLRVARRARDAQLDVLVPPADKPLHVERAVLLTPPVFAMAPPLPAADEPAAHATASATPPTHDPAEPAEHEPATTADTRRDAVAPWSPCFALSVHALGALGTTAFHLAGYQATNVRQSHGAGGVRVACHPHGTWWSVEGNVSAELPVTPTTHILPNESDDVFFEVNGPRLRADVGLRGRFGQTWMATFHVAIGLQAYYLDVRRPRPSRYENVRADLPFEGVLSLGMGLEYRAGDVLLGIDLHVRQGVPADYHSVSGVLSFGIFLDQGE